MDDITETRFQHYQRQVAEQIMKMGETTQGMVTMINASTEREHEHQRRVYEKLAKTDEQVSRLSRAQEEMKKALREVAEYLGRLPRSVRRPKTRPAGPALPAAAGDAGVATSSSAIPILAAPHVHTAGADPSPVLNLQRRKQKGEWQTPPKL